ncbi:GNAT family N-acetyltransferase [Pseudanabaena catenata USMAC16]|uniref:GCN5-related N-acetyltransferase n=3 Tax=Pseudanabaena TaxID=1152 RepID=L8N4V0_9CYAN|nr:GNAT family N-acetyltransferase [Pseudanabaena catenata]ELS34174.1 GCN5-related N-acetyltransferase [Pseudanabaena biceps PCC 7429]MDG3493647.1 GNAT family N-acetyltransferase [Pseudanabaena catenata USMAC16]
MNIPNMQELTDQFLTLQTPRLILRKLLLSDAEDIFAYASDPLVSAYTLWDTHHSLDDTYRYLNDIALELYRSGQGIDWGIVDRKSNRLIGTCGLYTTPMHRRAEIGYALARDYWGQGLMSEAVRAAIAFGFHVMQLLRIQAFCALENIGSARVLEKSGMQFEGILHNYVFTKAQSWDVKMYAITRSPIF